jgi:predicted transcriptional regulator
MRMSNTVKKPVQIDMSPDLLAKIDHLAREETLTRTAWMRRTLNEAVKAATQPQDK